METTKITKRDIFNRIIEKCGDDAEIVACMENEIVLLDNKAAKAKARAAAKKEAGDELRAVIEDILANAEGPMTREMVLELIEDESGELTPAKVGARISQLVQIGKAEKTSIKTEDGKTKVAYTLVTADAE